MSHRSWRLPADVSCAAVTALLLLVSVPASGQDRAIIDRGAYLAIAGNCQSCHTAEGGAPFAGGLPVRTPFGILNSPNITPDEATGIGGYDRDDFVRSLREGVNGAGQAMYPAHPYTYFTRMTDTDVDAVWAFLRQLEPVGNEVDVVELPFPYDLRIGVAAWRAAFFEPERFEPDAGKSDEWNRGAYLVNAVAHCGACHTPRNIAFAGIEDEALEGGEISGWYAPDISSGEASAIRDWDVAELTAFLRTGETSGGVTAFGPMAVVVHGSLARLHADDVRAIAVYLKDTPLEHAAEPLASPSSFGRTIHGEALFRQNCAGCHLPSGEGMPGGAAALVDNSAITAPPPNDVVMAILEGFAPTDQWGGMPSFARSLSNVEVASIANYVRTAWTNRAAANASPELVAELRSNVVERPWEPTCPNLSRSFVDADLVEEVRALSTAGFSATEAATLVADYGRRFPEVNAGMAKIALSTAHCRVLAQQSLEREATIEQSAAFNILISKAIDHAMPRVAGN